MKNTLGDLNNYLFAELERLDDEELQGEKLQEEIERAKAVNQVAFSIITNGRLMLDAVKAKEELLGSKISLPPVLEDKETLDKT